MKFSLIDGKKSEAIKEARGACPNWIEPTAGIWNQQSLQASLFV